MVRHSYIMEGHSKCRRLSRNLLLLAVAVVVVGLLDELSLGLMAHCIVCGVCNAL